MYLYCDNVCLVSALSLRIIRSVKQVYIYGVNILLTIILLCAIRLPLTTVSSFMMTGKFCVLYITTLVAYVTNNIFIHTFIVHGIVLGKHFTCSLSAIVSSSVVSYLI